MSDENVDVWLRMYQEQVQHARHHETLRSQSTAVIVSVSAAVLAFLASAGVAQDRRYLLGALLVIVNLYGLLMSLKHYERSRLHVTVSARYRDLISEAAPLNGTKLNDARKAGHEEHAKAFRWTRMIRAYAMWSGLHRVLAVLGIFVCFAR